MSDCKFKLKSGVYIITCLINNKHYVGYSLNVEKRLTTHKCDLKFNRHPNSHLQSAYNLYGIKNFSFDPLEYYPEDQMASFENWWCNMLNTHDDKYGFNIEPTGNDRKIHSEVTKRKIGNSNRGKKISVEQRKKLSEIRLGIALTEDHKLKISLGNTGKKMTYESKLKLSRAKKGKPVSEKVRERLASYNINRIVSDVTKKKISEAIKLIVKPKHSAFSKNKISKSNEKFVYEVQTPTGSIITTTNVKKFADGIGKHNSNLYKTLKGGSTCGGYKIISKNYNQ